MKVEGAPGIEGPFSLHMNPLIDTVVILQQDTKNWELAMRLIYSYTDAQFSAGHFGVVGRDLDEADCSKLAGQMVVGLLAATYPATRQLGESRANFVTRAEKRLIEDIGPERTKKILSRLG